jgi:glycine/D-amino acid oxidase-like deaminating enzyme
MVRASRKVVVIGGGISGTLVGHALNRAGWQVCLVEAAHVGAGSSSRTAAGIRQQFSTRETVIGMQYSTQFYSRWREEVGGHQSPIQQNGYLFLFNTETAFQSARTRCLSQQAWGLVEIEALDRAQLAERFPFVNTEELTGGTWCPTDGFLRPETITNDAADALRNGGGVIHQNAEVVEARHSGGRLVAVRTAKGWHEADLFVDCTNAWSRKLGGILGAEPLPIAALKRYLWFIDRGHAWQASEMNKMPLVVAPGGAYCRPENPNTMMVGWAHKAQDEAPDFSHEDQDFIEADFFHRSGTDTRPYAAWMQLAEAITPLGDFAGISATTSGFYGSTPDHNPFLDFDPKVPNLLRMVGFSGHGAMFGPFTAAIATALAEAGKTLDAIEITTGRADLSAFQINRDFNNHEQMVI